MIIGARAFHHVVSAIVRQERETDVFLLSDDRGNLMVDDVGRNIDVSSPTETASPLSAAARARTVQ